MKCNRKIEWVDSFGFSQWHSCSYPSKYEVRYNGVRGEPKKESVCGVHLRAMKMNHKRLLKMDIDSKLEIAKL